jgi:predicted MFS family arabinose efflux permease
VLTIPPLSLLNALLIKHVFGKQTLPFGWSNSITPGAFVVQMATWSRLFVTVAMLLLTVLFLSDLVFVLSRAGIEPDKKAWRRLLVIRQWSTPLGLAAIIMILLGHIAGFLLYVFL